jgi:Protein of unknown function with PCYCGC motif
MFTNREHRNRLALTCATISVVSVLALGPCVLSYRSDSRAETRAPADDGSAQLVGPITLDPKAFTGPARDAYRVARKRPDLLVKLRCYCGCDRVLGHRNLLDCYRSSHAASCEICIGEAEDADNMAGHGSVVEEIREALRARYGQPY